MKIRLRKSTTYYRPSAKNVDLLDEGCCLRTVNLIRDDGHYFPAVSAVAQQTFAGCPEGVEGAYYSEGNGALFVITATEVYRLDSGASEYVKIADSLSEKPFFVDMYINGFSATTMFSGNSRVVFTGMAQDTATDDHLFSTGVVHCGRFFAVDKSDGFKLWWAASHPLDWEEGIYGCGYVWLPAEGGKILRLFSYDDRLVAVRERGITVVRAYGGPQNYKVDATANYLTADGIIGDTCALCGGQIVFCTDSGIYAFDGSDIERLMRFDCGISAPLCAAACGERYFLMCTEEHLGEGCVYCFDLSSGLGAACDIKPSALFSGPDGVYAVIGTAIKKLLPGEGEGEWYSAEVRFGGSRALLKSIEAECDGEVSVTVSALGVSRTFSGSGVHRVGMSGSSFSFCVQAGGTLRTLTARAEV